MATADFTLTAKDKLKNLSVTQQTSLVTNGVTQDIKSLDLANLKSNLNSKPKDVLNSLLRLKQQNPITLVTSGLNTLKYAYTNDKVYGKQSAITALTTMLKGVIKDKNIVSVLVHDKTNTMIDNAVRGGNVSKSYMSYTNTTTNVTTTTPIANTQVQNANTLANTINATGGQVTYTVVDAPTQTAVAMTVMQQAATVGSATVMQTQLDQITDPTVAKTVAGTGIKSLVTAGNITAAQTFLDYSVSKNIGITLDTYKSDNPTWIIDTISNFVINAGEDPSVKINSTLAFMDHVFNNTASKWYFTNRLSGTNLPTVQCYDLRLLVKMNQAFKDALKLCNNHELYYACCSLNVTPSQTAIAIAQAYYPSIANL